MGTSSSGSGPKGRTPLLPSWATDDDSSTDSSVDTGDDSVDKEPESEHNQSDAPTPSPNDYSNTLQAAKSSLTKYANGGGGSSLKKAGRSYLRGVGGAKKATKSSSAGIKAGGGFVQFLGSVSSIGVNQTLEQFGLSDCIGKSTEVAFARIANEIVPEGDTNDEAIAREAVLMALERLYLRLEAEGKDISTLDQLDNDSLRESVTEFVGAYIFRKWIYEAGLALERNELSKAEAIELEVEVKDFVMGEVKSGMKNVDIENFDLTKGEGGQMIKTILELSYSTLEK